MAAETVKEIKPLGRDAGGPLRGAGDEDRGQAADQNSDAATDQA